MASNERLPYQKQNPKTANSVESKFHGKRKNVQQPHNNKR